MIFYHEQQRIFAYLDGLPPSLSYGDLRQAKVNALRELQSKSGEELSALMSSKGRWGTCRAKVNTLPAHAFGRLQTKSGDSCPR